MNASSLSQRILGFSDYLRQQGYSICSNDISDSLHAISSLNEPNKQLSEIYFRTLFCREASQWQQFHQHFNNYWLGKINTLAIPTKSLNINQTSGRLSGLAGSSQEINPAEIDINNGVGAGKQNTIGKADFRFLNDSKAMQEAENLAETLATQLKRSLRRKKVIANRGRTLSVRHTLRHNLSQGGIPIKPRFLLQTREPPKLVVLHDVSHSMTWNNPLLFRFVRGLVNVFHNTEAFVFHTKLHHVTEIFKLHSISSMKKQLEATNNLWLGGTCIAQSISTFNKDYANVMLNKKTSLILISDGFDTEQPSELAKQLKLLKSRADKVLWLNPMVAREGYIEDASAKAARPYVDNILPAHSLNSLREVIYRLK